MFCFPGQVGIEHLGQRHPSDLPAIDIGLDARQPTLEQFLIERKNGSIMVNKDLIKDLSWGNVIKRLKELEAYLESDTDAPPRDYDAKHWRCRYCEWKDLCLRETTK